MVIAPLDANTMAKIANGLCDNLLVSAVYRKNKVKSTFEPSKVQEAFNSGSCSMKQLEVLLLPPGWDASPLLG